MASLLVSKMATITHLAPPNSNTVNYEHKPTVPSSFQRPKTNLLSIHSPLSTNQIQPSVAADATQMSSFNDIFQPLFHGSVDSDKYASIIEPCKCLNLGRQIHAHTLKTGFSGHEFLETKLLLMYGRCASVESAALMFEKMLFRNIYSWAGILTVYTDNGYFEKALLSFIQLQVGEIDLEFFIFPIVFKACSGLGALELGRQLHGFVTKRQFLSNLYVGNALIDMYGKCGVLDHAKKVFAKMPKRDCVTWNSLLTGCAANGMVFEALGCLEDMQLLGHVMPNLISWSAAIGGFSQNKYNMEALELLYQMQSAGVKPNARTLASVLPACARLQTLSIGKEIHGYITRHNFMSNAFVINGLVDVYRRCADMSSALKIFSKFSMRNLVSFNTMIVGYCENGEVSKAKELFDQMDVVGIKKDTISWNSMLSGYVDNCEFDEAFNMFKDMLVDGRLAADSFTLGSVLTACADLAAFRQGKEIHSYAITRGLQCNAFVGGALVEVYCKCGDLTAAQAVFNEITERDVATWNVLISGYAHCDQMEHVQSLLCKMKTDGFDPNIHTWNGILTGYVENGYYESALQLFSELQTENLKPDIFTVGIILPACSRLSSIKWGKQIHAYSIRCGYDTDVYIGVALVDMNAKCGSIRHAWLAFNRISQHNLVSLNTMLTGYAMHGHGKEGIALFHQMLADGIMPDKVTFLSVLCLCVHIGSVDVGYKYFNLMANYRIKSMIKHYTCMVDLLGRAGQLNEAYELVMEMPVEADAIIWGALLSGCIKHGNTILGEVVANKLIELEPSDTGNYVMLANLYASAGRWDDLARTWQIIKDKGMQKSPGCSWIEDRDHIHVFLASDRSHRQTDEIYATLENLTSYMIEEGYVI